MRSVRLLLIPALLALFAFATMAPHFTTWDSKVFDVSFVSTEILSMDLSRDGRFIEGTANVAVSIRGDGSSTGEGLIVDSAKVSFSSRCISPLCGGFDDPEGVPTRGEIRLLGTYDGDPVMGQGTYSADFVFKTDGSDPPKYHFQSVGVFMRTRLLTLD